jgi:hypothetical protein
MHEEMASKKKPIQCRSSVVETTVKYCLTGGPAGLADHPRWLAFSTDLWTQSKKYRIRTCQM